MRILIAQPKRSKDFDELKTAMELHDCDCVLFPEGYIHGEDRLDEVCKLAKKHRKAVISSYLANIDGKDRAVLINEYGNIVFKRKKSEVEGPLLLPSTGDICSNEVGYMLCREIFLDYKELEKMDIIFNPIGVGMFSEDQFVEWLGRARMIAKETNSYLVGASHADGSYRNCGFSIPISYVFDKDGSVIYLSKNDTISVIIDLESKQAEFINT